MCEEQKIWVLYTEDGLESPGDGHYFMTESAARAHGIELTSRRAAPGTIYEWLPLSSDPSVARPELWPDAEILWEIPPGGGEEFHWYRINSVKLLSECSECMSARQ